MKTRTRKPIEDQLSFESEDGELNLEHLSDEELESLLFEEEDKKKEGIWNLPTIAGLSLILVGIAYILQELGWQGIGVPNLGALVEMLPWLAGILIILLGFGVLSWRPKKKKSKVKVRVAKRTIEKEAPAPEPTTGGKRKLWKSRDKKLAGVAGGIAEYFNLDPTLVRIAFVIGTIVSEGAFLIAYFVLAAVMPKPESRPREKQITIIRDQVK
ncbi:MAG: PspC domain-containing protein [Rhodothermales bacterium]